MEAAIQEASVASKPHHLDVFMLHHVPTVMVPRYGKFKRLSTIGHRYLVSSRQLWLEVRTSWLYFRYPITDPSIVPMPWGDIDADYEAFYGDVPVALFERFREQARNASPNETGAWITWSPEFGFKYYALEVIESSGAHLVVKRPDLGKTEELVFDLHSHGLHPAFFSPTDNKDDRDSTKFAGVYGCCDKSEQDFVMRLLVRGIPIEMTDVFSSMVNN